MRKSIHIREGQLLAIPAAGNLIFPALVTKKENSVFLLYIFKPVYSGQRFREIQKDELLMVALCDSSTDVGNEWQIISSDLNFNRNVWPVPVIATWDEQEKKHYALMYNEDLKMEFRLRISGEVAKRMQGTGIYCRGSLEKKLSLWMSTCYHPSANNYPALSVGTTANPGFVR